MQNSVRDLPLANEKPTVQVFAIINQYFQYEEVGTGSLEIVSDDFPHPQHYIEVSSLDTKQLILRSRLQLKNHFQRQQKAIICWEDNEQLVSEELALSFEKIQQCDIYWKLICEKIGKNYLEINGHETLHNPTPTNLPYILDKTKNSYELIAFHIINSETFMVDLIAVFRQVKQEKDQNSLVIIMKIIEEILSHADMKIINELTEGHNFRFLLQLYQESTGINFPNAYKNRVKIKELVPLSTETNLNIIKIHNSIFFRDCIIDLSKDISLQHVLNLIIREAQMLTLNNLLHENILQKLISFFSNSQLYDGKEEDFIAFIFQIIGMLKLVQSQSLRKKYADSFYSSGIFRILEVLFLSGNEKALEIFDFICLVNPHRFFQFFRDQFRESPSMNLNSIIQKQYSLNEKQKIQRAIINFLNTILNEVVERKQFLDFFNGTFLYSVFNACKIPFRNLSIIRMLMEKTKKITGLVNLILKMKFFYKLELSDKTHKKTLLELFKVLKLMIQRNNPKNDNEKSSEEREEDEKIAVEIVQSGVFKFCLEFFMKNVRSNCLLTSILRNIISLLADMPYNGYIQYMKKFPLKFEENDDQDGNLSKIKEYIKTIQTKQEPQSEKNMMEEAQNRDAKRRHHRGILLQDDEIKQETGHREVDQDSQKILDCLIKIKEQRKKESLESEKEMGKKIESRTNSKQVDLKFDFSLLEE